MPLLCTSSATRSVTSTVPRPSVLTSRILRYHMGADALAMNNERGIVADPWRECQSPAGPAPVAHQALQRSRCRSLPAGDRCGGHGALMNRRQGRLLQCQAPPPRQSEATVGACLQAIDAAGTAPERIAGKAGSYSAKPHLHGKAKPL